MKFKIGDLYVIHNEAMIWTMTVEYLTFTKDIVTHGHKFVIHDIKEGGGGGIFSHFKKQKYYNPTEHFYESEHIHVEHLGPIANYPEYIL